MARRLASRERVGGHTVLFAAVPDEADSSLGIRDRRGIAEPRRRTMADYEYRKPEFHQRADTVGCLVLVLQ